MTGKSDRSAFPLAGKREMGYDCAQVDSFLDRARAAYDTPNSSEVVTAAEVRETSFKIVRGGYAARYVDAAMDRLEEVFFAREKRQALRNTDQRRWMSQQRQLSTEVFMRGKRRRGKRFRRRSIFATGYRVSQVDAFVERALAGLAGQGKITAPQVRESVFHNQWRGYDEAQVDSYLDAITELILAER